MGPDGGDELLLRDTEEQQLLFRSAVEEDVVAVFGNPEIVDIGDPPLDIAFEAVEKFEGVGIIDAYGAVDVGDRQGVVPVQPHRLDGAMDVDAL